MNNFLSSLGKIIVIGVTILGFIAAFIVVDPITILILLFILFFLGFVSLIIYQINKIEGKITKMEKDWEIEKRLIKIEHILKIK